MKLAEYSPALLRRAASTYLALAYAGGEPPAAVRARGQLDGEDLAALLAEDRFEKARSAEAPERVDGYRLRLGNAWYPHMKLGLVRCGASEEFVLVADTHDRHIAAAPDLQGNEEYAQLLARNNALKAQIEARWREEGLPCAWPQPTACRERGAPKERTVLLVDDDPALQEGLRTALECEGYQVIVAGDGPAALTAADGAPVALCLLDIMLPGMDGEEVARRLRTPRRFPVVFLSALPPESVQRELADGYIRKPFLLDSLLEEVAARLQAG
jgi:CheY-like chemotaxis protein